MSDMIDRRAAIGLIHSLYPSAPILRKNRELWKKKYEQYIEAEKALEQMPSAQPRDHDYADGYADGYKQGQKDAQSERKTGKWIDGRCNQCGNHAPFWSMATTYYESNYCQNCGAKMEGR